MVVVGDRRSANTQHLAEICRQNCSRVLQIESADELSTAEFAGCRVAGLTAGASTPAGIIKEVKAAAKQKLIMQAQGYIMSKQKENSQSVLDIMA